MIILDTNVISEAWRIRPNDAVIAWIDSQSADSLYLCTPVLAEIRYGIERMPDNARKTRLHDLVETLEADGYRDRILSFDQTAAAEFGKIAALRERIGRRLESLDAFIAAIAISQRATLATRDIQDFSGLDLKLINPFNLASEGR